MREIMRDFTAQKKSRAKRLIILFGREFSHIGYFHIQIVRDLLVAVSVLFAAADIIGKLRCGDKRSRLWYPYAIATVNIHQSAVIIQSYNLDNCLLILVKM